jgi:hypothetical protein
MSGSAPGARRIVVIGAGIVGNKSFTTRWARPT